MPLNFDASYAVNKHVTSGLAVFHLAGKKGHDIEYLLGIVHHGEGAGGTRNSDVNDRHIHPMEPRCVRLNARYTF